MTAVLPLVDQAARERIEHTGLHETLFVEAGAGTGKTHELVNRVVNLVVEAQVPLCSIAAITFTEAAAAELRDRIREAFERRLAASPADDVRTVCERALAEIDEAAIGTLHGFCLRILNEHPLEVGLPPRVDVFDEVSSELAFQERWRAFVDELHADPMAEQLIVRAWVLGAEIDAGKSRKASLKDVASIFEDSWDRLDAAADESLPPLSSIDIRPLETAVTSLRALRQTECITHDRLASRIDEVVASVDDVLGEGDELRRLRFICARNEGWRHSGYGNASAWKDKLAAHAAVDAVREAAQEICSRTTDEVLRHLAHRLARYTRDAAEQRRAEGRLDFHDLLVLARRLVRQSAVARATLHDRYQRLLLDEFQDTDPIQIEVAAVIAAAVEGGTVHRAWSDINTEAGRLFFVGDPKQSIYRFRRADIGLFLEARDAFSGGAPLPLQQNFRTVEPILGWVNHVFGRLMADEIPGKQPQYQPLAAVRSDHPADHRVVLLGGPRKLPALALREEEARAVASAIASVRDEPESWPVFDEDDKAWRHPKMADVTILVPTRTSLRQLEDALDAERIPYRVATGTLVYDTQEVREVIDALRAIDDPGDALALVSALRSPLYACSDVDLFTFHQAGGRFDLRRNPPLALAGDHSVVAAMTHLRSLWEERWWDEPSELLDRLLRERNAFALAFTHRRPREVWRRLRFLVDQARAFEEAGGGGLRAFLDWAELQRSEGTRAHELLDAETDDDAVSIATIHGAKGLEFPITIVSGATTQVGKARRGVEVLWDDELPKIRLRKNVATENFDRLADFEAEMDIFERRRLLYVACTRARDHLIVSTFHSDSAESYGKWLASLSEDVSETLCRRLPERAPTPESAPKAKPTGAPTNDRSEWLTRRADLLDPQREPRFRSATAIAQEAAREDEPEASPEDEARPAIPWRRGRAGTAIGRAVHATLQFVDGQDDPRLDELATQHAHLEAVPDAVDTVAALARSALQAPSIQAAYRAERMWRELYVAAPVGDRAIEGYIDLLYETEEGNLVLIDYKTDSIKSEAQSEAKVERYKLQTAAYALAVEVATGQPVVEARLVFCTTDIPIERGVAGFQTAKDTVRRLLEAGPVEPPDDVALEVEK